MFAYCNNSENDASYYIHRCMTQQWTDLICERICKRKCSSGANGFWDNINSRTAYTGNSYGGHHGVVVLVLVVCSVVMSLMRFDFWFVGFMRVWIVDLVDDGRREGVIKWKKCERQSTEEKSREVTSPIDIYRVVLWYGTTCRNKDIQMHDGFHDMRLRWYRMNLWYKLNSLALFLKQIMLKASSHNQVVKSYRITTTSEIT